MCDLAKSLATLVKYNGGFFKSEKQAAFLNSRTGGVLEVSNAFSLGYDYQNKLVGKGAKTVYTLDNEGVLLVTKYNSKGETVTFNRKCPKSMAENKARLEKAQLHKEVGLQQDIHYKHIKEVEAFLIARRENTTAVTLNVILRDYPLTDDQLTAYIKQSALYAEMLKEEIEISKQEIKRLADSLD